MHQSVLAEEVTRYLNLKKGMVVVDGTVGCGGHARLILEKITPGGRLIGIDYDAQALAAARRALEPFGRAAEFVHGNFANLRLILNDLGIEKIDGLLFDLGVSSLQLDSPERGFSFRTDAPLDMRMDQRMERTAADLVNGLSETELARILKEYGEEYFAGRIARAIAYHRQKGPITTTFALAEIVRKAQPRQRGYRRIHPATKTFQALRIAVNDELNNLRKALDEGVDLIKAGRRIVVISFHSLEDRIVKQGLFNFQKRGIITIVTRKPVRPSRAETASNPRSRSARLRVGEKV